ncbi:MAG: 7-cyano-7-deazaguanine synthase [Candidatus Izemoplasmatales bacterium]|nr:7-cyano-7-deazaguanine synthase [Candidatus Izemoplasmatales bacterium]
MNSYFGLRKTLPYETHFNSNNMLNIKEYNNSIILDLFDIFAYVFYADLNETKDEHSGLVVEIEISVENINTFLGKEYKFEELIHFAVGEEKWKIKFVKSEKEKKIVSNNPDTNTYIFNSISLLSAGLDSLSGACKEIGRNNKTLFVTYRNRAEGTKTGNNFSYLSEISNNKVIKHVEIHKDSEIPVNRYTQRTRSLLFLACALLYADYYGVKEIKIYENGIMSQNPSFDERRGVTKTTHPKTLYMFNEILHSVDVDIKAVNPYQFYTKGQVINEIPAEYRIIIKQTRTCSKSAGITHFAGLKEDKRNCGVCIACTLRKIGIKYFDLDDYDANYYFDDIQIANASSKRYMLHQEKSLKEYYMRFNKEIKSGRIFIYLEGIEEKYYSSTEYLHCLKEMLNQFSLELEKYYE